MDSTFKRPLDPDETIEKVIAAINQDIEPLLPADQYPRGDLFHLPFEESFLWGLGRKKYVAKYGHVLLSRECVAAIARVVRSLRVLDVCAGGGFLAQVLANEGVDVQAVDLHPPGPEPTARDPRTYWKVDIAGSAFDQPLSEYDVLLMVWPSFGSSFATRIATAMSPGQTLIYQGEGPGGCTANDDFYKRTSSRDWRFLEAETEALNEHHVRFHGAHDRWYVLQKIA